jgi:hypothetical protein
MTFTKINAGWSSLVARRAHNPKVGGSNPPPATKIKGLREIASPFLLRKIIIITAFITHRLKNEKAGLLD